MSKVSVVIPTYNYGRFLGEAIQSVLDQTFQDFEVIVVDDGSTDNTKEVVDSFKDSRIRYIYQENSGESSARNNGIKASSGEYIAFLDSDDWWLPRNLELKVRVLDSRPDVALVCSDVYFFDDQTGVNRGRWWHDKMSGYRLNLKRATRQPLKELCSARTFMISLTVVVRRLVFAEVGYFDESLQYGEDWEMWVRIVQRFPIETIDIPLGWRRKHDASQTADFVKRYPGLLLTRNKVLCSSSLSKANRSSVKKMIARYHFNYGKTMLINGNIDLGREKLLAAIKVNPWRGRPYIYLVLSLMGYRTILTIKSCKKWLGRHLIRPQSSGDAQSDTSEQSPRIRNALMVRGKEASAARGTKEETGNYEDSYD